MALIALASPKGSPGVSVTTAGLTTVWPRRVVLADLDPVGSDVALRYRTSSGAPLDTEVGLLSLGVTVRRGAEDETDLTAHLQTTAAGMETLVGVASPGQVQGLGAAWPYVANALKAWPEGDVLADCGRITPGTPTLPVIERADALVLVTPPSLEGVSHLRERLSSMKEQLGIGRVDGIPVGVAVVSSTKDTRSAADTEQLLLSSGLPVTSLGTIARDPKAADTLRTESDRSIRRSDLVRSLTDVAGRIDGLVTAAHDVRQGAF